jgi:fermentation-respiration switch protein FrsA (DUF1100 family)
MIDISRIDYSELDRPEMLMFLFHPRPERGEPMSDLPYDELHVPVAKDVTVGGRFYVRGKQAPTILYFHGNGEIVADYEDVATLYVRAGLNFLPVDYRGYGKSTGKPTVTAMMRDSHVIFDFVTSLLRDKGFSGPLILMGRSLGSASALELVSCYEPQIHGLVVESGFAWAEPLLQLIGIDTAALGFREERGFRNIDKIRTFPKPTLVIHAEQDHIIPFSDGQALYEACPAPEKRFLPVPGANHNDIFLRGMPGYLDAVKELAEKSAPG